jgi:hypothetical protein
MKAIIYVLAAIAVGIALLWAVTALAQHNHDAGHNDYRDWASQKTGNCCNERDCGELAPDEWRETPDGTEVKLKDRYYGTEGRWGDGRYSHVIERNREVWCPIKPEHRVLPGTARSPNYDAPHLCARQYSASAHEDPCERIRCFMGKPES